MVGLAVIRQHTMTQPSNAIPFHSPTMRTLHSQAPLRRTFLATLWGLGMAALACLPSATWAQVGMTTLQTGELETTLVYPTAAVAKPYTVGPFTLHVALNAPVPTGKHRVVVISHGTGGSAVADHHLAATLARAGLVVAQPLHRGDNHKDTSRAGPESFKTRPAEVTQVINALAKDPRWKTALQLDRVGVHGMSAGGVTALSLAGGQWRMLNLVRHCNTHRDADIGFCLQGATTPHQQAERLARFDKAKYWPDFVLPAELKTPHGGLKPSAQQPDPRPDPRVAAVTLAVPVGAIFSPESLARIRIPVGLVSAQQDGVLVPRFHSGHVLKHCTPCITLADLPGAGHFDVLAPWPTEVALQVAASQYRGGLPNPGFDAVLRAQAHDKIAQHHIQHLR